MVTLYHNMLLLFTENNQREHSTNPDLVVIFLIVFNFLNVVTCFSYMIGLALFGFR